MKKISDREFEDNSIIFKLISWLILLFLGFLLLILRNADPILKPVMYTEDGFWIGIAYTKGWLDALLNAKNGYFVWGNISLLALSSISSKLICGAELVCLPQAIAFCSYMFFSATAAIAFFATKEVLPLYGRLFLYSLIIFVPLGDSSNEIIGRLSNIGYLMVLWCVLLVYWKSQANGQKFEYLADTGLIFSAATNPLCMVLIPILAVVSCAHKLTDLSANFFKRLFVKYKLIFFALAFEATLSQFHLSSDSSSITGELNYSNLIEVGIARSILYPFLFPIYSQLNNSAVLFLFGAFIISLIIILKFSYLDRRAINLLRLTFVALFIFIFATLYFRQSLTQQLGGYLTTFPDRYFMGLNVLVALIFSVLLTGAKIKNEGVKVLKNVFLAVIFALYASNQNLIFEFDKPRLKIVRGATFLQSLCEINPADDRIINIPIYFSGWSMSVPYILYDRALGVINCKNLKEYVNNEFYTTDKNWIDGIARDYAGFFTRNTEANQAKYRPGSFVIFANGQKRLIMSVEKNGKYLNIFLRGEVLNSAEVGFPSEFEVRNE